jgi:hypothetical protein
MPHQGRKIEIMINPAAKHNMIVVNLVSFIATLLVKNIFISFPQGGQADSFLQVEK